MNNPDKTLAIKSDTVEKRPEAFNMSIQGGMLEALGLNMYTSVGKCLVEFVANSYDSESSYVRIDIPFEQIDTARAKLREKAKQEVKDQKRETFTILLEPLGEDIAIVIEDNGHGMTPTDVQKKFLALNRNRRLDGENKPTVTQSEGKKRYVMGRKGLGKLAAFGTAEMITIWTKRKGETFATEFSMDYSLLKSNTELGTHQFKAKYYDGLNADQQGTTITLKKLRCDALKAKEDTICGTLHDNFWGIDPKDFSIELNKQPIPVPNVDYEYVYPEEDLDQDGFRTATVDISDITTLDIRYIVKFRRRTDDFDPENPPAGVDPKAERGPLSTNKRGARIYCNNRLALGPSLLDLGTGMHNFHAQSYMECIVHANDLDRQEIDFVNTSRSDLRRDNEVVDKSIEVITAIMKASLIAHSKFKGTWTETQIEQNKYSKDLLGILKALPKKTQKPARQILITLASHHGIKSKEFEEAAPLLLQAVNASEVLIQLIEQGHNPTTLQALADSLSELAQIENQDVLKHYRGRRESLSALEKLLERGEDDWKGHQFEGELHSLLKANPWILRPEYGRYLNSNTTMGTVLKSISKEFSLDNYAEKATTDPNNRKRPDLVFLLMDGQPINKVLIVELKSPNIPLDNPDLNQLERYISQVKGFLKKEYPSQRIKYHGHLIGAMPASDTKNPDETTLLDKIAEGKTGDCEVIGLHELLSRAQASHSSIIEALEKQEEEQK